MTKTTQTEMAQTETARPNSPVPCDLAVAMIDKTYVVIRTFGFLH